MNICYICEVHIDYTYGAAMYLTPAVEDSHLLFKTVKQYMICRQCHEIAMQLFELIKTLRENVKQRK